MIKIIKICVISLLLICLYSCNTKEEQKRANNIGNNSKLFSILLEGKTGISFKNVLKENNQMNGLFYEYYYNGGGVAVGDLNGDDLTDIYFINNLKSNSLYLNQGGMKFKEITQESGTKGKGFSTGVTMVDINADGKLDIYISNSGRFNDPNKRRNQLLINKGNNHEGIPFFEDQASKFGLDLPHFSTQTLFFDYDLDNDLDMFLINHGVEVYDDNQISELINKESIGRGEKLYRNDNNFFVDVTAQSGIISNLIGFGLGVSGGDLNNDGFPDVYVSNDFSEKDHLYFNNGDGTFTESSHKALNHMSNFSMGNDIADINNDGWMDIMTVDMASEDNYGIKTSMSGMSPKRFYKHVDLGLHHQYMYNTLQLNNGSAASSIQNNVTFSEVAHITGLPNTDWSWAPLFFDMDNSGYNDLFISNGIKRDFRNNDFQNFHKKLREEVLANKEKGMPFNKSEFISSLLAKMPTRKKTNYFFKNNGNLTFDKMNKQWTDNLLTSSNGAAYADFDNDGDLDIVVNNSDDISYIYQNSTMEKKLGDFLKIKFKGPKKNINGIGCRVSINTKQGTQVKEQFLTRGFQSSVDKVMHFGIGKNKKIDTLKVIWPDGSQEVMHNIEANKTLTLEYEKAVKVNKQKKVNKLFSNIVNETLDYKHKENEFNDFERESLLPHRMSQQGPALAVSDVNGDGLDDFYIGGALGYKGVLYIQTDTGAFEESKSLLWEEEKQYEDVSAAFFDADQDGDADLFITSGGNEREVRSKYYQDRLYVNNGKGIFIRATSSLPQIRESSSCIKFNDFDNDGDLDLFIGGRQLPEKYPNPANSYLFRNDSKPGTISFKNITQSKAPILNNIGMVTDANWSDIDSDGTKELIIVGEWMSIIVLKNINGQFTDISKSIGLSEQTGWWYSINAADFDNDGDIDLIAGNLGLNYKYKATKAEPFEIYASDFDTNGTLDIVLSYHNNGSKFPIRGRECSSNQMPFIKDKFPTYDAFGKANMLDVYGQKHLENALHYSVDTFATTYFENNNGMFEPKTLPILAQITSTNSILIEDFNNDSHLDIVLSGNLYGSEVETPRNDAGYGVFLAGDGKGNFLEYMPYASGLLVKGEVKHAKRINIKEKPKTILFARNNLSVTFVGFNSPVNLKNNGHE